MCVDCNGLKANKIPDVCIYNLTDSTRQKLWNKADDLSGAINLKLGSIVQNNFMSNDDLEHWKDDVNKLINKINQYKDLILNNMKKSDIITSNEEFEIKEKEYCKKIRQKMEGTYEKN